jgi:pimeloyl-ACP methyl ester carboxylesterase
MADQTREATRSEMPIILVRGFGGLGVEDERRIAYQGFNDGTVYPQKRGENYIYEGLILRFMKSNWQYQDATNVVGYYEKKPDYHLDIRSLKGKPHYEDLLTLEQEGLFKEDSVVIDPAMARLLLERTTDLRRTLWVFRYYDLTRSFPDYAKALVQLIAFIRRLAVIKHQLAPKVNIIAHSMGGLIVREAIQTHYRSRQKSEEAINKIVTLGTPHRGITFQVLKNWVGVEASKELEFFNPEFQDEDKDHGYKEFGKSFDPKRLLCVVGTNYKSYGVQASSWANRLFSSANEFGVNYNRSDGLVKQSSAQIPGAPRTFVHKCHGGFDSLVTSREAFEVASRFFFGNTRARLRLLDAKVMRGLDTFGKSEVFFGVSIKPRRVDFDLFHQSAEAENCYGPFQKKDNDLSDDSPEFGWAGENRLIWEGWLDTSPILRDASITSKDMVFRLDFYVGERDLFGIGFSDNVIFRKQYYIRALIGADGHLTGMWRHSDENFALEGYEPRLPNDQKMKSDGKGWQFDIGTSTGSGFRAKLRVEIAGVPESGEPIAIEPPDET